MSAPVMSTAGQELYDALFQLADDDEANGWALAHVCNAIGEMRQRAMDLFEDRDGFPGWSQLFDVERCPGYALPFLAQVAGTKVTVGASEEQQRDEVRRRAGQARGRPASLISAVQATLTGDKTVRLVERAGGSAWQVVVVTRTSETPDSAATLAAALSQKPGGIVLTLVVSDDPIWFEATLTYADVTGTAWEDLTVGDVT